MSFAADGGTVHGVLGLVHPNPNPNPTPTLPPNPNNGYTVQAFLVLDILYADVAVEPHVGAVLGPQPLCVL